MTPRPGDLVVRRTGAHFLGRRFPCALGRAGIGFKRGEGDDLTPRGIHRLESVLYRRDRLRPPRTPLPLRPIGPADGWSDDPADPAYNALVPWPSRWSAERLRRPDPLYDLVAVTDWNRAPIRPGCGSAIFLHVRRGPLRPTAGCVAFRREDLLWILARWRPASRILVP